MATQPVRPRDSNTRAKEDFIRLLDLWVLARAESQFDHAINEEIRDRNDDALFMRFCD